MVPHSSPMQNEQSSTPASPKSLAEIIADFREVKHDINNSLGVIMALSELAEKKPETVSKLKDVVLTRAPNIVASLQKVADDLQRCAASNPQL